MLHAPCYCHACILPVVTMNWQQCLDFVKNGRAKPVTCSTPHVNPPLRENLATASIPASAAIAPTKRKDFAKIQGYGAGSSKVAHSIASDPTAVASAVLELKTGMLATGSRSATKSRLKTWDSIAGTAGFSPVHFTASDMVGIIAVFNSAGYRSVASYVTDAKQRFVQDGGCWTQQHQLAYRQCLNATSRGKGPNKGASPFPLHLCHKLPP